MSTLVSVQNLKVSFRLGKHRVVEAVRDISFDVPENGTLALVGESGSGKSVTAMAILNLLPDNAERSGRIEFLGLGVPVDQVSWGTMLSEAQAELVLGHWWQLAAATAFMATFVTAFSLFTDALRDALDPKLRGLE